MTPKKTRLKSITFFLSDRPLQLTSLELQYVSPKLLMCRDLELAVPGTYDPNQPIIRIQSIAPSLQVITSKQRPRKLTIMGKSHGEEVGGWRVGGWGVCVPEEMGED